MQNLEQGLTTSLVSELKKKWIVYQWRCQCFGKQRGGEWGLLLANDQSCANCLVPHRRLQLCCWCLDGLENVSLLLRTMISCSACMLRVAYPFRKAPSGKKTAFTLFMRTKKVLSQKLMKPWLPGLRILCQYCHEKKKRTISQPLQAEFHRSAEKPEILIYRKETVSVCTTHCGSQQSGNLPYLSSMQEGT